MSKLDAAHSPLPGSTYGPGTSPQLNAFARRVFFLSVGSAAVPVLISAVILLQGGQGLPSKRSLAKSANPASAHPIAAISPSQAHNAASPPAILSSLERHEDASPIATGELSWIASQGMAGLDAEIARSQGPRTESDIFQRESLVRLAVISVPTSPGIPDTESAAIEEQGATDHPATTTAAQAKKIRTEFKAHTVARHRHRPQKHVPPSLLAKIGQSVKKGLMQAAKFPREAMTGRLWE